MYRRSAEGLIPIAALMLCGAVRRAPGAAHLRLIEIRLPKAAAHPAAVPDAARLTVKAFTAVLPRPAAAMTAAGRAEQNRVETV